MQERSEIWRTLAATGTFLLDSVAVMSGKEYSSTSAPVISRGLFSDMPTVGNCTSASLRLSILTDDEIPKSAEIQIKQRLLNKVGGTSSEWLPAGTFFITKRSKDYSSGLITLQCYDAMLKAQQDFFRDTDEIDADMWPRPMAEIVPLIATRMGVEIDGRTIIRTEEQYSVKCPEKLTMIDVLGFIGAAHGGNWIITPEGKLRLVPLTTAPTSVTDHVLNVVAVLSKLTTGRQLVISKVTMTDDSGLNSYTTGDDTGYELTVSGNPYASQEICDDLYETLNGLVYNPFTMDKAIYDPAAELGDPVTCNGLVYSVLAKEDATLNTAFRANISAPTNEELEDEYPYLSNREKEVGAIKDDINDLITIIADKASISDLYAIMAIIENLSADNIKAGIIRSSDYAVTTVPFLYPASDVYPASNIYPSNGESVTSGFAIDFSTGMIYGALYSSQIELLQNTLDAIDSRLQELENDDHDAQIDSLRTTVAALSNSLSEIQSAIDAIDQKDSSQDDSIEALQTDVFGLKQQQSDMSDSIDNLLTCCDEVKSSLSNLADTVAEHSDSISSLRTGLTDTQNNLTETKRTIADMQDDISQAASDIAATNEALTNLAGTVSSHGSALEQMEDDIAAANNDITSLRSDLTDTQGSVASLRSDLTSIQDDVSALQSDLIATQGDIDEADEAIAELQESLENQSKYFTTQKAYIVDLQALIATIEDLSAGSIITSIVCSDDYSTTTFPFLYPANGTFPASGVYPSDGSSVVSGFAIDFSTGTIYGTLHCSQIEQLESALGKLNERLLSIEEADYTDQTRALQETVDGFIKTLSEAKSDIALLSESDSAQNDSIEALQSDVLSLNRQQSEITQSVEELKSDYDSVMETLDDLGNAVASQAGIVSALQSGLTESQNGITEIRRNISTVQTSLQNTQTELDGAKDDIAALGEDFTALQGGLADTDTAVTLLQDNLADTNAAVSTLQSGLANAATAISSLQADLADTNSAVSALQTDIGDANDRIDTIQSALEGHSDSLSSLGVRVSNLETASAAQSQTLADIQNTLTAIQSAITALQNALTYPKS